MIGGSTIPMVGNILEAGADIGGMAAALNLLVPIPMTWIVIAVAAAVLALQIWASYTTIRNIFRWLALALLAYVGSAVLAKPELQRSDKRHIDPHYPL